MSNRFNISQISYLQYFVFKLTAFIRFALGIPFTSKCCLNLKAGYFSQLTDARFLTHFYALLLGFALCPIFAQQLSPERPFLFWLMIVVTVIWSFMWWCNQDAFISTHWLKRNGI